MLTRHILTVLMLAISIPLAALAQQTNAPPANAPTADAKARAQEVLKQARAAIWDEAKSKPLKSLSITANIHRPRGGRDVTNETTIDILMPDKFLRVDVYSYGIGSELTSVQAINGTRTWSDLKLSSSGTPGSGGGVLPPAPGPPGNESGRTPDQYYSGGGGAPDGGMMIQFYQAPEAEVDRMLLSWLLIAPATLSAEFAYAGETQVEGKTADIIEVTSPGDFKAKLYIAQDTHQVLMLSHTVKIPRLNIRGQQGRNQGNRQPPTREEREKRAKEIQEALAKATEADMREVEIRWLLSDYRNINGFNLPYQITKSVGGQAYDRVEVKNIRVNPALRPDKFVKK